MKSRERTIGRVAYDACIRHRVVSVTAFAFCLCASSTASAQTEPGTTLVPLELEADSTPVRIGVVTEVTHSDRSTTVDWRDLCTTPCTLRLQPGHYQLHIGDLSSMQSVEEIDLPASGMHGHVRPFSFGRIVAGAAILGVGALVLGVGAFAAAVGVGTSPPDHVVADVGWGLIAAGGAGAVAGIVVMALGGRHGVDAGPLRGSAAQTVSLGVAGANHGALALTTFRF